MRQQSRQAVGVVLTLVGDQDTAVAAHDARTDCAAVSVRIGRALIYMHGTDTAQAFARAFHDMSGAAVRLSRTPAGQRVAPTRGMGEPAIVVEATGVPSVVGKLIQGRGEHGSLRLTIGRIVFDVRDIPAFASTLVALREAELLARTTFRLPDGAPRRQRAVEDAAKAFAAPPSGVRAAPGRTVSAARRTAASPAPSSPRLSEGRIR
ncbi:hypothetical protein [Pseudonocardia lacus]|uniref:hypothetical protein n=1 Tax=Pseudonocardia lacus TaxID=2835865 RepID=UPI001BDD3C2E|nr:hypothetical protein [Pseudonocardia lacus]